MRIIVCKEKHGNYYYDAHDDETLNANALEILTQRWNQNWYIDSRETSNPVEARWYQDAKRTVETGNPLMAWRLLENRSDMGHEYESVALDNVDYSVL